MPSEHESQTIPTIVIGWERQMTARTNMNLQGYASKSVYKRAQTDLDELLADKFQLSLGVRHRLDCCLVSFGVTENLQNLNNTPDVGFQIGFAWLPRLTGAGQALREAKPSSSHSARARSAAVTVESPAVSIAVALNSTIQARHLSAGSARE